MDNESTPTNKMGMNQRLQRGRARMDEFTAESKAKARRAVRITNNYAHDHPWRMALTGAALAFVAGFLVKETVQRPRKVVINREVRPVIKVKQARQSKFELIHALIPLAALGLKALSLARAHADAKNAAEATKAPRGFA